MNAERPVIPGENGRAIADVLAGLGSAPEAPSARDILASILENSPDPVILFNGRAQPILANPMARRFWSEGKLVGNIPDSLLENIRRVHKSGRPYHRRRLDEMVPVTSREGTRYFLPSIFPAGKLVVVIFRDETAWELSVRIRNNLFSSISHELKTPLTSARVSLYLLAEQRVGELNKVQTELVESARNDLDREILSIRNLLDLIRSEGHQETVDAAKAVSLRNIVRESLKELEEEIRQMELTVKTHFDSRDLHIPLDRDTSYLVVHQVICASIRQAEPKAGIRIGIRNDEGHARLEVNSTREEAGRTLPADLFAYPLESDKIRELGATALGLRFAHELVRKEGGAIRFRKKEPSSGLVFEFPLPENVED